jgi:hypothetical protein
MPRFLIKTPDSTRNIQGEYMTIHGDTLYIYGKDDELVGLYKLDQVILADKT